MIILLGEDGREDGERDCGSYLIYICDKYFIWSKCKGEIIFFSLYLEVIVYYDN